MRRERSATCCSRTLRPLTCCPRSPSSARRSSLSTPLSPPDNRLQPVEQCQQKWPNITKNLADHFRSFTCIICTQPFFSSCMLAATAIGNTCGFLPFPALFYPLFVSSLQKVILCLQLFMEGLNSASAMVMGWCGVSARRRRELKPQSGPVTDGG